MKIHTFALKPVPLMLRINAEIDSEQGAKSTNFAKCPKCGQILFDVESVRGYLQSRCMCRRCRTYIKVEVVGN